MQPSLKGHERQPALSSTLNKSELGLRTTQLLRLLFAAALLFLPLLEQLNRPSRCSLHPPPARLRSSSPPLCPPQATSTAEDTQAQCLTALCLLSFLLFLIFPQPCLLRHWMFIKEQKKIIIKKCTLHWEGKEKLRIWRQEGKEKKRPSNCW